MVTAAQIEEAAMNLNSFSVESGYLGDGVWKHTISREQTDSEIATAVARAQADKAAGKRANDTTRMKRVSRSFTGTSWWVTSAADIYNRHTKAVPRAEYISGRVGEILANPECPELAGLDTNHPKWKGLATMLATKLAQNEYAKLGQSGESHRSFWLGLVAIPERDKAETAPQEF